MINTNKCQKAENLALFIAQAPGPRPILPRSRILCTMMSEFLTLECQFAARDLCVAAD